jgi:hypothetical protein
MEIKQLSDDDDDESTRKQKLQTELDEEIRNEWLKTFVDTDTNQQVGPGKGQVGLSDNVKEAIREGALSKSTRSTENPDKAIERHASANDILKRVLLLLHSGLQLYDKEDQQHNDYTGSVARALSHGGRVNIRIPSLVSKKENAYALTDWLGITKKGGKVSTKGPVGTRSFGTHHVEIGKNDEEDGEVIPGTGSFRETGSTTASGKNIGNTELYGMDLSVGGIGKLDFNGDVILPDGAHGHMFIGYRPPTLNKDGALQIGIETTAPGAGSTVGYHHGPESSEATANPESSFGGLKQDKIGDQVTPGAKIGGSSNTIKSKKEKVTYDMQKYKTRVKKEKSKDKSGGGKKKIDDMSTMGRYVDLYGKHGRNWLHHLDNLEEAFELLHQERGTVTAYKDLINKGELIKGNLGRMGLFYEDLEDSD